MMDLAEGHVAALQLIEKQSGVNMINLGVGKPCSVLEMIATFEKSTGQSVPVQVGKRRDGDLPIYYASAQKAKAVLGWEAMRTLGQMCESSWHFQSRHLADLQKSNKSNI